VDFLGYLGEIRRERRAAARRHPTVRAAAAAPRMLRHAGAPSRA
jgi:hypothetical protein